MFEGLSLLEFSNKFSTDEKCYEYLSLIKWQNGYKCAKCSYEKYFSGKHVKLLQQVQLQRIGHLPRSIPSAQISLRKAFYIVFLVVGSKRRVGGHELSRKLGLRQKNCWLFKRKSKNEAYLNALFN